LALAVDADRDGGQEVLDLAPALDDVGQLEQLAEADHVTADGDLARHRRPCSGLARRVAARGRPAARARARPALARAGRARRAALRRRLRAAALAAQQPGLAELAEDAQLAGHLL